MYFSTRGRNTMDNFPISGDEMINVDDGDVNLHLAGIYLAFTPEEWDALVLRVAKARGLLVIEQPFSSVTLVPVNTEEGA
jgi:hypothetical protein